MRGKGSPGVFTKILRKTPISDMYVGNFFDVSKILISTQIVPNLLIDAKMYTCICRSPFYYYNIISKSLGFIYDSKRSSKPYCSFYLKLNLEAIVWIKERYSTKS